MSNIYYVYAYLRESDFTPYYIGKGCKNRATDKNHLVSLPRNKNLIVFLETNLTEVGAFALERRYIKWYGRKDIHTGILHNKTDGGDAPPNIKGIKRSDETKIKMKEARKNRKPLSDESRERYRAAALARPKLSKESIEKRRQTVTGMKYSKPCSEERKQKIRNAMRGRKRSDEQKNKIRQKLLGIKRSEETRARMSAAALKRVSLKKVNSVP